ncbi:hypothetical protein J5N97_003739 [Dioscorea zingiberensis]|uniref:Uncharacterized protein n=1 Tax=Dioscorea zingiberensis TaxID=325984 RepID=A0A9D5HQT0_9LILI|nr:hypothetical protein J5N97_003739 [Dioscorea zingiberensis]
MEAGKEFHDVLEKVELRWDGEAKGEEEGVEKGDAAVVGDGALGEEKDGVDGGEELEAGLMDEEDDGAVLREREGAKSMKKRELAGSVEAGGGIVNEEDGRLDPSPNWANSIPLHRRFSGDGDDRRASPAARDLAPPSSSCASATAAPPPLPSPLTRSATRLRRFSLAPPPLQPGAASYSAPASQSCAPPRDPTATSPVTSSSPPVLLAAPPRGSHRPSTLPAIRRPCSGRH